LDTKEIVAMAAVISAVVSAVVSAAVTIFVQSRERDARKRELILKVSVELTKTYIERISSLSQTFVPLPDLLMISLMHKMVRELFEDGKVSEENRKKLTEMMQLIKTSVKNSAKEPQE
jgi:hypothetical protein